MRRDVGGEHKHEENVIERDDEHDESSLIQPHWLNKASPIDPTTGGFQVADFPRVRQSCSLFPPTWNVSGTLVLKDSIQGFFFFSCDDLKWSDSHLLLSRRENIFQSSWALGSARPTFSAEITSLALSADKIFN